MLRSWAVRLADQEQDAVSKNLRPFRPKRAYTSGNGPELELISK